MILVFVGPPGSGKGTQAELVSNESKFDKLSTGDIIRGEIKSDTELGRRLNQIVSNGELVPDELMEEILYSKLRQVSNNVILDGFPRTLNQAKNLEENFGGADIKVFNFEVSEDILIKRITGRYICSNCNVNYNKYYNNTIKVSVCDNCGSTNFTTRGDDNEETLKARLEDYKNITSKVIDYYNNLNRLYNIDATKNIDEIKETIISAIKNY